MTVQIPDSWQQLHWKKQVGLAREIITDLGEAATPAQREMLAGEMEAAQARAVIATEAKRQADEARKPTVAVAALPESDPGLLVYLDYDVWVPNKNRGVDEPDTIRLRANPTLAQRLPFDLGKRMLAQGKARRADPLPGELAA